MSFGVERKKAKDSPGNRVQTALHLASRGSNLSKVIEIIQRLGVNDINAITDHLSKQNKEGKIPFYVVAENGHSHVVVELMKHHDLQTASIVADNRYNPFHVAAMQGHLEVLKQLLGSFLDLAKATDLSNSTALYTAATYGRIDIINLLLDVDPNLAKIPRNTGKTLLHYAARSGSLEVVKSVLRKDPTIGFQTDKKGQTALHLAVKSQNMDILDELIKPDPTILSLKDYKGNTPLHFPTRKGRTKVLKPSKWGMATLTRILIWFGLTLLKFEQIAELVPMIVEWLLSFEDVNIDAVNKDGEAPLDIAKNLKIPEIISILEKAGATHSKDYGKLLNVAKKLK